MISPVLMLDLFAPNEPTHTSFGKRACTDKDLEDRHVCAMRSKEDGLKRFLRESRCDEEKKKKNKYTRCKKNEKCLRLS